jgi:enterochelin esterase family protein
MATRTARGPAVKEDEVVFSLPDRDPDVTEVALAHELTRPRRVPFARRSGRWRLRWPRPDADRVEYMLELKRGDDSEYVPDPTNPHRTPGPFGDKSVIEFPGYEPPAWIHDDDAPVGELQEIELESWRLRGTIGGFLWSPAESDAEEPLPLLVVHDGPEYAEYSQLLRLLDHLQSFGEAPPMRAALLAPPPDRNEWYSASTRYSRTLTDELLPDLRDLAPWPDGKQPVGMGASLGALSMLHAHWTTPGAFGGLMLQSGSYFRRRYDAHESGFGRFGRIARFVGRVLAGAAVPEPIPVVATCGTVEENLRNNQAVAAALAEHGYDARLVENRDAHNWIAWRDVLHPHLTELLLRAWT